MNSNWVNLIKLCVGIETVDELKARQVSFDEKNKTKLDYRDVHLNTLTNEVATVPPAARVY